MTDHVKGQWYTVSKTSLLGGEGIHICDVRGLPGDGLTDEANAERIAACVNACDGYTTDQLKALAGGNVKREVTRVADKLCEAENRYLKAEAYRDRLRRALEALLEHEGTVDDTGIGEMPSQALEDARHGAMILIEEVKKLEQQETPL